MLLILKNLGIYVSGLFWGVLYWMVMLVPAMFQMCLPKAKKQWLFRRFLLGFGFVTVRIAWRPFFKVRYEDRTGEKKLEPGIVVVNHRSATDGFLISVMGEPMAQTVNGWPLRLPFIGWGAKLSGYLDMTGCEYEQLKMQVSGIIRSGDSVAAFPEGTRSASGKMNVFHSGIFQIAIDLNLPVHLLCIAGNERMPDRNFIFREFKDLLIHRINTIPVQEVLNCKTAYSLKKLAYHKLEQELLKMDNELKYE